jgi:hypothetical protein
MTIKRLSKKVIIKTEDIVEYETKGNVVAVRLIGFKNGKKVSRESFFTSVDSVNKNQKGKNPTVATFNIPNEERFDAFDLEKFKRVEADFAEGVQFYKHLEESVIKCDAIDYMESDEYSKKNLIRFKSYDHTFYRFGSDIPISMPYHIDYIGGVTNGCFDLDAAEEILKKNKYVYSVKRINIPYYNSEKGNDTAVEFAVQLPQSKFNKIYSALNGEEYFNMKDVFSNFYVYKGYPDVLKLKKALLSKKEREFRMGY